VVRPRRSWEDNIKTDFQEVALGARTGLIGLEYRQVAGCCECGNEILNSIKGGDFLE
jgi:hypothetical protein